MSHVAANLPNPHQEVQCSHPFRRTQPRLTREVVKMCDEALHHVGEALVVSLRVYGHRVLGDVINGQIHHRRDLDVLGIHVAGLTYPLS
jgi:hypothetical protein